MACPPALDVRGRNRMMEFSGFKNTGRDILTICVLYTYDAADDKRGVGH